MNVSLTRTNVPPPPWWTGEVFLLLTEVTRRLPAWRPKWLRFKNVTGCGKIVGFMQEGEGRRNPPSVSANRKPRTRTETDRFPKLGWNCGRDVCLFKLINKYKKKRVYPWRYSVPPIVCPLYSCPVPHPLRHVCRIDCFCAPAGGEFLCGSALCVGTGRKQSATQHEETIVVPLGAWQRFSNDSSTVSWKSQLWCASVHRGCDVVSTRLYVSQSFHVLDAWPIALIIYLMDNK